MTEQDSVGTSGRRPLEGRVALVTGSSSGLGAAIARAFGTAGATVGVTYRNSEDGAREVAADVDASGGRAVMMQVDVSDEASVGAMFDRFSDEAGELDILVANAGVQQDAAIGDMTLDQWRTVIDVNLTGQFLCVREAVRRFDARGGTDVGPRGGKGSATDANPDQETEGDPGTAPPRAPIRARGNIICMSSVHESIPWAFHVNYAAAKGGVMLLMKSVAQEVACRGIRVNGIAPGAIATPINADARDEVDERERLLELIPYGRIGDPEDVGRAALWLASDASDYVVGTTLYIDGGMSLYPEFRGNG